MSIAARAIERAFEAEQVPTYNEIVISILCDYVDKHGNVDELAQHAREYLRKKYGDVPVRA